MGDIAGQLYNKLEPILDQERAKIYARHGLAVAEDITDEGLRVVVPDLIEEMENKFIGQAVDNCI